MISILPGLENPIEMDNPAEEWMPNQTWNKFCELSLIDQSFGSIVNDFGKFEEQWRKIYESNSPHREEFPPIKDSK